MDIKAFRKASFDLVRECKELHSSRPEVSDQLVKMDDDALWIRFTAIGSLLDYCENNEEGSVLAFCARALLFELLTLRAVERND